MRISIEIGADGRAPDLSADPVVVLIDGCWTAVARFVRGRPRRAWLVLQRRGEGEHVTTGFWSPHGWRPAAELDVLPVSKSAKALGRRALRKLPTDVVGT